MATAKALEKLAKEAALQSEKIDSMPEEDKALALRLHEIVAKVAPELTPKLYYGQPGWAKDGKVVVFFRSGRQDKLRYSTLGVSPLARLDDASGLWPTSYALADELTDEAWNTVEDLVRKAISE